MLRCFQFVNLIVSADSVIECEIVCWTENCKMRSEASNRIWPSGGWISWEFLLFWNNWKVRECRGILKYPGKSGNFVVANEWEPWSCLVWDWYLGWISGMDIWPSVLLDEYLVLTGMHFILWFFNAWLDSIFFPWNFILHAKLLSSSAGDDSKSDAT